MAPIDALNLAIFHSSGLPGDGLRARRMFPETAIGGGTLAWLPWVNLSVEGLWILDNCRRYHYILYIYIYMYIYPVLFGVCFQGCSQRLRQWFERDTRVLRGHRADLENCLVFLSTNAGRYSPAIFWGAQDPNHRVPQASTG